MFDINDIFLNQFNGTIQASTTGTYAFRFDAKYGRTLKFSSAPNLSIFGQIEDSLDDPVDMEATGIDVSDYEGQRVTVIVTIEADTVTEKTTVEFQAALVESA